MELKITEKKEEPLLSRIKLTGELSFDAATPSYKEVKQKISSSLSCDEKLIVIRNIYTEFGLKKGDLLAYVYKNGDAMKKAEANLPEEKAEEKPAEAPAEKKEEKTEKKEEKKADEKKEEKKE